jgi:hypothetical protein
VALHVILRGARSDAAAQLVARRQRHRSFPRFLLICRVLTDSTATTKPDVGKGFLDAALAAIYSPSRLGIEIWPNELGRFPSSLTGAHVSDPFSKSIDGHRGFGPILDCLALLGLTWKFSVTRTSLSEYRNREVV